MTAPCTFRAATLRGIAAIAAALAVSLGFSPGIELAVPVAHAQDSKTLKRQAEYRSMAEKGLQRLYKAQPGSQAAVQAAAGYAVFSDTGIKIFLAGSGKGHGLAVNNRNRKETVMKLLELQAGLGFGVKKFTLIFVFDTEKALTEFIEKGWELGGQSTVAAKTGSGGKAMAGATAFADGVWVYQLTDKGLALEITVKGTRFSKDDDLND